MSIASTLHLVTAQATGSAAGGENALMGMLPIILMFVILYFLMIRPQMKRQKTQRNMVAALAKGDEVITSGDRKSTPSELQSLMRITSAVFCLNQKKIRRST